MKPSVPRSGGWETRQNRGQRRAPSAPREGPGRRASPRAPAPTQRGAPGPSRGFSTFPQLARVGGGVLHQLQYSSALFLCQFIHPYLQHQPPAHSDPPEAPTPAVTPRSLSSLGLQRTGSCAGSLESLPPSPPSWAPGRRAAGEPGKGSGKRGPGRARGQAGGEEQRPDRGSRFPGV